MSRVAVVTGAARGIGKATAELLADRGFTTVRISRTLGDAETTRRCDVADEAAVRRVFEDVASRFGRLDVLINAAGISSTADPLNLALADWDLVLHTNVVGTYFCCKHSIPPMQSRRYGRIVNVSSIAGRGYSETASVAYTCSKYAVIGLTKQLAATFARDGIHVNCVCPSQTKTNMLAGISEPRLEQLARSTPIGRLAEPVEVAEAIVFLATDAASYITGAVLDVNGGRL